MLTAVAAAKSPALVIGADCPVLTLHHLRIAAQILRAGDDAVVIPAEDGGYALIGLRTPERALFVRLREIGLDQLIPIPSADQSR